jgi:hypothetical protein
MINVKLVWMCVDHCYKHCRLSGRTVKRLGMITLSCIMFVWMAQELAVSTCFVRNNAKLLLHPRGCVSRSILTLISVSGGCRNSSLYRTCLSTCSRPFKSNGFGYHVINPVENSKGSFNNYLINLNAIDFCFPLYSFCSPACYRLKSRGHLYRDLPRIFIYPHQNYYQ